MSTTVRLLTGHKVTVSESDDALQWECSCGRRAPGEWCPHMYAVVCRDGAAVPLGLMGRLEEANRIIAKYVNIVEVLTARLMQVATLHGGHIGEIQQLEAAIARLTSGK